MSWFAVAVVALGILALIWALVVAHEHSHKLAKFVREEDRLQAQFRALWTKREIYLDPLVEHQAEITGEARKKLREVIQRWFNEMEQHERERCQHAAKGEQL